MCKLKVLSTCCNADLLAALFTVNSLPVFIAWSDLDLPILVIYYFLFLCLWAVQEFVFNAILKIFFKRPFCKSTDSHKHLSYTASLSQTHLTARMEKWQESSGKYALCLCITELLQTAIRQEEVLHNKTQYELTRSLRNVLLSSTFSSLLQEIFSLDTNM